jgi:hypothetical protein
MPLHGSLSIPSRPMPAPKHYMPQSAPVAVYGSPSPSQNPFAQQYYLPMPNARTQKDLIYIDNILSQMQDTIYENANHATPGVHIPHNDGGFNRYCNVPSPPASHSLPGGLPVCAEAYHTVSAARMASSTGTPAVTPSSSSMSYTSGHSFNPSSSAMSPQSRHASTASVMYPTLPTSLPSVNQDLCHSATTALGPSFESSERRRYSGGMLQRARGGPLPLPRKDKNNSGTSTPKATESAVSAGSSSSESAANNATREREEQYDRWLENMRIVKTLRQYVRGRLEHNDFDDENQRLGDAVDVDLQSPKRTGRELPSLREGSSLYPILHMPST